MNRSATDVMQDVLVAAVLDAVAALKAGSKGLPNNLLRDLNAIHANTTLADLPKELQDAIAASVRGSFNRLLKEGYTVVDRKFAPPPPRNVPTRDRESGDRRPPRHMGRDRPPGPNRSGPRKPGGGGGAKPGGGGNKPGPRK